MCMTLGKHCITKSEIGKACSAPQSTFELLIYKAKGQALDLMFQQIAVTRCWQVIWGMWSSKNLWNLSVSPSMRRGNAVLDSTKKRDQPLQVHLWLPQILEKSHKGWGYSGPWTFVAWPSLISSSRFLRIIYNDRERKTTVFDLLLCCGKAEHMAIQKAHFLLCLSASITIRHQIHQIIASWTMFLTDFAGEAEREGERMEFVSSLSVLIT